MVDATSDARTSRPLRLGMVGGGRGAFIGAVHRLCARMDGCYDLVAGALSSAPERARDSGVDLGLASDRIYTSFSEMAAAEAKPYEHCGRTLRCVHCGGTEFRVREYAIRTMEDEMFRLPWAADKMKACVCDHCGGVSWFAAAT